MTLFAILVILYVIGINSPPGNYTDDIRSKMKKDKPPPGWLDEG